MTNNDDHETAGKLTALSTSILSDATGGKGALTPGLIRFSGAGTVAARAITADCDEGSLQAVFAALEHAQPGNILCILGPGNSAYLGDLLAANIAKRELVGAVIDGYIRDRKTISALPLTFIAKGLTPVNQRRTEPGRAMVPVVIGGVTINPGDWMVADDDGVIVIRPSEVDAAIAKAEENARIEERILALVAQGVKITDAVPQAIADITGSKTA